MSFADNTFAVDPQPPASPEIDIAAFVAKQFAGIEAAHGHALDHFELGNGAGAVSAMLGIIARARVVIAMVTGEGDFGSLPKVSADCALAEAAARLLDIHRDQPSRALDLSASAISAAIAVEAERRARVLAEWASERINQPAFNEASVFTANSRANLLREVAAAARERAQAEGAN